MKGLSRRGFVILAGAAGGAGAAVVYALQRSGDPSSAAAAADAHTTTTTLPPAPRATAPPSTRAAPAAARWSDPKTWSRGVPGPGQTATVTRTVVLDVDARVGRVNVMPGGRLIFDPKASRRLDASGNVVVLGALEMRPASAAVRHRLVFGGVQERSFAGGGMEVLPRDTGLWVMGAGKLDLAGAPKLAWTRAAGALAAGATSITLQADPAGWRVGDELAITPTASPATRGSTDAYDLVKVKALKGRTVTLSAPLRHAHPSVGVGGKTFTAEVLNLTRNVNVEGTPQGRSHIFVRSTRPQAVAGTAIRHVGPRKPDGQYSDFVLGRYGLHFHMCGEGSRGSVVDGVVIRDAGSHAFVAHMSHGVTFRNCISHDTFEDAYWWDGSPETGKSVGDPTNDTLYQDCVASLVRHDPVFRGYRLAGFFIGRGRGNKARGCVAVGVQGSTDAAGFIWPEGSEGIWGFSDCVAHNNDQHGIFTWQNTNSLHVVERFTGYHNAEAGISHGAYANPYVYRDSALHGNRRAAVIVHATSHDDARGLLTFANLDCDGAGLSDHLVVVARHAPNVPVSKPTRFSNCSFSGARKAAFGWLQNGGDGGSNLELFDITGCSFAGNEFWLSPGIARGSRITVRDAKHGSLLLRRRDQAGDLVTKWNARVTRI